MGRAARLRKELLAKKAETKEEPTGTFYFSDPETYELFDPNYGIVRRKNPNNYQDYFSKRTEGMSWFMESVSEEKIKEYVLADIQKLYDARRFARGIIKGSFHPNSPIFQRNLVCGLLKLSVNDLTLNPERSIFLGENENRVKDIGRKLYGIGGHDLMSYVANNLVPFFDSRELDICWHGIGEWKC